MFSGISLYSQWLLSHSSARYRLPTRNGICVYIARIAFLSLTVSPSLPICRSPHPCLISSHHQVVHHQTVMKSSPSASQKSKTYPNPPINRPSPKSPSTPINLAIALRSRLLHLMTMLCRSQLSRNLVPSHQVQRTTSRTAQSLKR
jgi:hypothetical protein